VHIPDRNHPITIAPAGVRVTVVLAGEAVASSDRALVLDEAGCVPVYYLPREDVAMHLLEASGRTTSCPYKGLASHYSIPLVGELGADAAWSYVEPQPVVAVIAGHLAFDPDRATIMLGEV
jgi:uncharacterized protein (DUF427 family)